MKTKSGKEIVKFCVYSLFEHPERTVVRSYRDSWGPTDLGLKNAKEFAKHYGGTVVFVVKKGPGLGKPVITGGLSPTLAETQHLLAQCQRDLETEREKTKALKRELIETQAQRNQSQIDLKEAYAERDKALANFRKNCAAEGVLSCFKAQLRDLLDEESEDQDDGY